MAEYRGLTIRIGADASRFTAALKATQGAISATQKNLTQLKKALQFDPGSKNAAALYVGELQSQAVAAAAKVQTLQRGIDDLRTSMSRMDPKGSIGDIAKQTDNAALSARRAREAYNDVTAALASMYTNLSELSHKTFDLSDEDVKKKTQELLDAGKSLREAKAEIKKINQEQGGKTFNANNSDLVDIRAELDRLVEAGEISSEQADNAYRRIERLKGVFLAFGEQLDDSLDVEAVHNYTVEMEKLEAQVKALAEQRVAAAKNDFSDSLEKDRTLIRNAADEAQNAVDRFKILDDAFQLDPTNFDKAAARTSALDDAIASTAAHADELRATLRKYEDAGFTTLASETPNLNQALDDAKVSATEAEQRVIEFKNQLSDVESRLNKARVDGADYLIPGLREQRETLRQIIVAAEEYSNEMLSAFQRLQNASDARDTANQLQTVENTLTELQNTARDTAAVIEALATNMRDAMPNELETRLGSAREQLDGLATESRRAQDALEQFDKRLQLDPGNAEKIADKMHAIEVATEATNAELEQTRSIIARYEASGIDKVADSTPNLAQALADAEQKARYASVALAAMKQSADDFDASEIKQMEEALERAVAEVHEFESAQGLNEARGAAMGLVNTLGELRASAREVRLDQALSGSKAEIKATEDAVEGLSQEVRRAGDAFELAEARFELNPTSIENMSGRFDALQAAISVTKEKMSFLETAISDLESRGIDDSVQSMRNLAAAAERAKEDFAEFDTKAGDLENQLSNLRQKMSRLDEGSDEFKSLAQQADNVESELEQVRSAAERALAEIKQFGEAKALQGFRDQLEEAKSTLLGYKNELNTGIFNQDGLAMSTMAVLQELGQEARQAFNSVVDATTSLDDALTDAKKTINDLDEDGFEKLKDSAVELSKVQPIDASTILQAEALGGQLGFAADEVEEFARVATGLDVATNMGWEDAANNMARFFNIMGTGHGEVENYGSAIVALGNNFATTESEISDMAMRIAGAGASMGLTEADVLGLATALSSVGLSAEAGGSSISQIMVKIDKAVANATDGVEKYASRAGMALDEYVSYLRNLDDDQFSAYAKTMGMTAKQLRGDTLDSIDQLQVWAETAGMSSEAFAEAWDKRPIEALTNLFSHMDQAADQGSNLSIMLDELDIKTIRQSDVARRVANSSELLVTAVNAANEAYEENTALSTEVGKRNESLSAQLEILGNCFDALKSEMGEGLLPLVQLAVSMMRPLSEAFDHIPTSVKTASLALLGAMGGFASFWAVIRGITPEVEALLKALSTSKALGALSWMSSLPAAAANIQSFAGAATLAKTGILALAEAINPLTLTLGVLAAATAVFLSDYYKMGKAQETFDESMSNLIKSSSRVKGAMDESASGVRGFTGAVEEAMSVEELATALDTLSESAGNIIDPVKKSNMLLDEYQSVIDEFAGKGVGNLSSGQLAELEWAVNGLNDALGTNFSAEDVLIGKYDAEGQAIDNLCGYIDHLIEKRKAQAEVEAAQQGYTDALVAQKELEHNYEVAEQNFKDLYDHYMEIYKEDPNVSLEKLISPLGYNLTDLAEALQVLDDAGRSLGQSNEYLAFWEDYLESSSKAMYEAERMYNLLNDSMSGTDKDWSDALSEVGIDNLDAFCVQLEDAGIKAQDLQNILNDPSVYFADWVRETGGDIDALIERIRAYNAEHVEEKTAEFDGEPAEEGLQEWIDEASGSTVKVTAEYEEPSPGEIPFGGMLEPEPVELPVEFQVDATSLEAKEAWLDPVHIPVEFDATSFDAKQTWLENQEVTVEVKPELSEDETSSLLSTLSTGPMVTLDIQTNVVGMEQVEALQNMTFDTLTFFVNADTSAADGAIQGVMSYEIPDILVEADAAVDSAISGLDSVTAAAGRVPSSTHTTAYANVSSALSGLWSVVSAANSIPSYKSVTVSFVTSGFDAAMSKIQSFLNAASSTVASVAARAASGGIRYHATGGIVDRPSWLGTRDIVGEAGAEAIIPLTNRKYVQPFADAVAEGMGKQLQPTQTVNNYYSINGLSVAPESALARAMDDTFNEAKRYSRMGKR